MEKKRGGVGGGKEVGKKPLQERGRSPSYNESCTQSKEGLWFTGGEKKKPIERRGWKRKGRIRRDDPPPYFSYSALWQGEGRKPCKKKE